MTKMPKIKELFKNFQTLDNFLPRHFWHLQIFGIFFSGILGIFLFRHLIQ